jgi:pyruvate dehydrogenase E2 component (dihydrolipoamide acetyltransferase)
MNLRELNTAFQDLVHRTQKGELRNRELTEGTVTVTNMGDLGSDEVFGIIFPPQVALIGLGRIHKTPVVEKEIIKPEFVIDITLSADHRVTDGLNGARFLASLERNLKNPSQLE